MNKKIYVDNIEHDEMRNGFLVTSHRKKLWNVQLNILAEIGRICRKYDIRYSLSSGTLLGAIRHKGFIPWDDEAEIEMLRPDYEKFKSVAQAELDSDYFLDFWYNYVHEGEPNPDHLPVIKREQLEKYPWLPFSPFLKIRDNRTTFIKYPEFDNLIQSIGIDVFPMDPVPPFDNPKHEKIFWAGEELRRAVTYPDQLKEEILLGKPLYTPREQLQEILSMPFRPFRERALAYENYLADNYFESEYISFPTFYSLKDFHKMKGQRLEDKQDTVSAKFELLEAPIFADYEKILDRQYGDWHAPKKYHVHTDIFSVDVPYKEYFAAQSR